jgi:hypothetical protein
MKNMLTLALVTLFAMGSTLSSMADDHHDAWSHDKSGYWDDHGHHQKFVSHNHHHGYWRTKDDGTRFFINID